MRQRAKLNNKLLVTKNKNVNNQTRRDKIILQLHNICEKLKMSHEEEIEKKKRMQLARSNQTQNTSTVMLKVFFAQRTALGPFKRKMEV